MQRLAPQHGVMPTVARVYCVAEVAMFIAMLAVSVFGVRPHGFLWPFVLIWTLPTIAAVLILTRRPGSVRLFILSALPGAGICFCLAWTMLIVIAVTSLMGGADASTVIAMMAMMVGSIFLFAGAFIVPAALVERPVRAR
jgi:hypothetical protein